MRYFPFTTIALCAVAGAPLAAQGAQWRDPSTGRAVSIADTPGWIEEINFETDSSIVVDGLPSLGCVSQALKENPNLYVLLEGYADGRGGRSHNQKLSQARADAVMEYLRLSGVPTAHMKSVGRGALPAGDKVTNFINRKVSVTLLVGSFDGPKSGPIALTGGCNTTGAQPVGRIESNGTTFVISVDYQKIRSDFRSEVARIITEERLKAGRDLGADRRNPARGEDAAKPVAPVVQVVQVKDDSDQRLFRVLVGGFSSDLKYDKSGMAFEGAVLQPYKTGAFQAGIQNESSSYRRKSQLEVAYTVKADVFRGSVIGVYGWTSGVAMPNVDPYNRTAVLAGARVGMENQGWTAGLTYLSPLSQQSSTSIPGTPMEPRNLIVLDGGFQGEHWGAFVAAQQVGEAIKNSTSGEVKGKFGGKIEITYNTSMGVGFSVFASSEPLYQVYGQGAETRVGAAIRFGGQGQGAGWIRIPRIRSSFPF